MQNNKSNSGASRFSWVDIAKGIAILLVVYRHILIGIGRSGIEIENYLLQLNEMVYSFRMPLFFILSGIFFARSVVKRSRLQFLRYKAGSLMYPYLLWAFIQVTLQVLLSKYTNANRGLIDYAYIFLLPSAIDQLWFLYALFNVTMIYFFLKYVLRVPKFMLLLIALSTFYCSTIFKEYNLIHDAMYYMLYFLTGDFLADKMVSDRFQAHLGSKKVILAMLPVFLVSQWYWLTHQEEINIFFFGIVAMFGSFFTISLSMQIDRIRLGKFLDLIGRNSLQIYVMHVLISSAFRILFVNVFGVRNVYTLLFISYLAGVSIPLILVALGKKYPMINWLFAPPK